MISLIITILIDYKKNKHIGDKNPRVTHGYPQTRWVRVWAKFQTRHGYGFLMGVNIFHGYGFGIATPFELERHEYVHLVAAQLYHHLVAYLMKRARQSLAHIFRLDDSN
jgi:hypothetical protein